MSRSVLIVEFTSCVQTPVVNTLISNYSVKCLAALSSVARHETKTAMARRSLYRVPSGRWRGVWFFPAVCHLLSEDAIQYAVYVLNCSSTTANTSKVSLIKILTYVTPALNEIMYRILKKSNFSKSAQRDIIIGIGDGTKTIKSYYPRIAPF